MNKTQIIGVSGTNGSGKDTIMEFLSASYEYLFMSATDMLQAELVAKNLPTDRLHKSELSAQWRREHGYGVIVQKAYEAFEQQASTYTGLVVGSLRHPAEAEAIHELGGMVLWIDADSKVRYERIQSNDRGRGIEDQISYEQFLADEAREMHPTGDAATLNIAAVKELSDITIYNDTDIAGLERQLVEALGLTR